MEISLSLMTPAYTSSHLLPNLNDFHSFITHNLSHILIPKIRGGGDGNVLEREVLRRERERKEMTSFLKVEMCTISQSFC